MKHILFFLLLILLFLSCEKEKKASPTIPTDISEYIAQKDSLLKSIGAFENLDEGIKQARAEDKPILLYFNAYAGMNCRKMERDILFTNKEVRSYLKENFIQVWLYADDKTKIENPQGIRNHKGGIVGWLQIRLAQDGGGQPVFIMLSPAGDIISERQGYTKDPNEFLDFLKRRIPPQPLINTNTLALLNLKLSDFSHINPITYPSRFKSKLLGSRVDSNFFERYFKFEGMSSFPYNEEHYYYALGTKIGKLQPIVVKVYSDICYEPLEMILIDEKGEYVNSFPVGVWRVGCEGSTDINTHFHSDSTFSQRVEFCDTIFAVEEYEQDSTICTGTKGRFRITALGKIDTLAIEDI